MRKFALGVLFALADAVGAAVSAVSAATTTRQQPTRGAMARAADDGPRAAAVSSEPWKPCPSPPTPPS